MIKNTMISPTLYKHGDHIAFMGATATIQISKLFERKVVIIFLSTCLNMCFECSKEPSYIETVLLSTPQHIFWFRNKKNNLNHALLSGNALFALIVFYRSVMFRLFLVVLSFSLINFHNMYVSHKVPCDALK